MRGAIEYYSRIAAPDADRGKCWLQAETDRDITRIRVGGRFSNAPFYRQEVDKLQQLGDRLPVLMLIRQNGAAAKGWRDTPFWWPVLFPPRQSTPAVFAASVREDDPPDEDNGD
jgi:hypothetical protein